MSVENGPIDDGSRQMRYAANPPEMRSGGGRAGGVVAPAEREEEEGERSVPIGHDQGRTASDRGAALADDRRWRWR